MRVLCAYNVNTDSTTPIRGHHIATLIHNEGIADEVLDRLNNPPGHINCLADFFTGLLYCMKTGRGAEWIIHDEQVNDYLAEKFLRRSTIRMGGNAGIMANALANIGANLVVPNVVSLSKSLQRLFSQRLSIAIPTSENGQPQLRHPSKMRSEGADLHHFIFEFDAGKNVRVGGEEIVSRRENRFIATYDAPNVEMEIDPNFERFSESLIGDFSGVLVSGFHLYTEQHRNKEGVRKNVEQIARWKELNSDLKIHLELGDFYNLRLMRDILLDLAPFLDSVGMNEEELAKLCQAFGGQAEASYTLDKLLPQAEKCFEALGVRRLCVHTREFSMSLIREEAPESEIRALLRGANVAAHLALTGEVVGRQFSHAGLRLSQHGAQERNNLVEMGGFSHLSGAYLDQGEYVICLNSSMVRDVPVTNVGLGDTFTAATFYETLR